MESQMQSMQSEIQGSLETKMEQFKRDLEQSFQLTLQQSLAKEIQQGMSQIQVLTASNMASSSNAKSFAPMIQPTKVSTAPTLSPHQIAYQNQALPTLPPFQTLSNSSLIPPYPFTTFETIQSTLPPYRTTQLPIPNYSDTTSTTLPFIHQQYNHTPNPCNRSLKLDFPIFNQGNPLDWISRAERYFKYYQIPDFQKREIASIHFEGDAIPWIDWFEAQYPQADWSQFITAFMCHFGAKGGMDFNGAISKLEQGVHLVEVYESEFLRLACRLPHWTDEQLRGCYISGLEKELQYEVLSFEPINLTSAMKIARLQESKVMARRSTNKWGQSKPPLNNSTPTRFSHVPSSNTASSQHPRPMPNPTAKPSTRPIRRLTTAEIQEKRDKNLCFKCNEPYKPGHQCRRAQLLLIEAEDVLEGSIEEIQIKEEIPEENGLEIQPAISLHSLIGSVKPQTMRLRA